LQSLTGAHVKAGHQNLVDGLVKFVAGLLALVVFKIKFAFTKMIVGTLQNLIARGSVFWTSVWISRAEDPPGWLE